MWLRFRVALLVRTVESFVSAHTTWRRHAVYYDRGCAISDVAALLAIPAWYSATESLVVSREIWFSISRGPFMATIAISRQRNVTSRRQRTLRSRIFSDCIKLSGIATSRRVWQKGDSFVGGIVLNGFVCYVDNLSFGSVAFRISAPKIWNSLPPHILQSQTLSSFRRHLKTDYFQSAYPAP